MPLRNFQRTFPVDPAVLENSILIESAKRYMGVKLYNMAVRVFTEFVQSRKEEHSGGYFQFAHAVGHAGQAPKKDVDYLWKRMMESYGTGEVSDDTIHRVLGTILMICVAKDPRPWYYKEDMEKREKLMHREIPDANEYFIGKPFKEKKSPVSSTPADTRYKTLQAQLTALREAGKIPKK